MKLYLLRPIVPWEPWYDKMFGLVVRAKDEKDARAQAVHESGEEGENVWENPNITLCEELLTEGDSEVLLIDFRSA